MDNDTPTPRRGRGRPRVGGAASSRVINIRLSHDERAWIDAQDGSAATVVRGVLAAYKDAGAPEVEDDAGVRPCRFAVTLGQETIDWLGEGGSISGRMRAALRWAR